MKLTRQKFVQADCRVLLAGVVLLLASPAVFACTCLPHAGEPIQKVVAKARNESRAVFSGTVVAIDRKPGDLSVAVRFEVEKFWKGALKKEVTVFTGIGGGDCGYVFEVGQRYLVYAYTHNETGLGTNICQRTASLIDAAKDLKALGKGKLVRTRSQKKLQ